MRLRSPLAVAVSVALCLAAAAAAGRPALATAPPTARQPYSTKPYATPAWVHTGPGPKCPCWSVDMMAFDGINGDTMATTGRVEVDLASRWSLSIGGGVHLEFDDPNEPADNAVGRLCAGFSRVLVAHSSLVVRGGVGARVWVDDALPDVPVGIHLSAAVTWSPVSPLILTAEGEAGWLQAAPWATARLLIGAFAQGQTIMAGWRVAIDHPLAVTGLVFGFRS